MISSSSLIAGRFALIALALLMGSMPLWSGDLTGWLTLNYRVNEDSGESFFSTEQRIRLNWATALSGSDRLNFYGQFSHQRKDNPDNREFRPLVGLNLAGPEYSWILEYREFEQTALGDGGFTFTNNTFFTTFDFNPDPKFPDLRVDFTNTRSKDNLDEPLTDFEQTDWGLRTTYERGSLLLRYAHRESKYDNYLTTPTTTILQGVTGVAVDQAGIIYITDAVANRVMRFSSGGSFLGEFGSEGGGEGQFREPSGIDVGGEFIYVADTGNDRVQKFDVTGRFVSEWGSFGTQEGRFNKPYGIAVDNSGVYVTDQGNDRVQKFTTGGDFLFSFGRPGQGAGNFSSPSGLTSNGNLVFVADTQNHRVQVFTTGGAYVTERGVFGSGPGQFQFPVDVALDAVNRVYVTDSGNDRVQILTATGVYIDEFGSSGFEPGQFDEPAGIALTPSGNAVVTDFNNNRFQVFTNNGLFLFEVGSVSGEDRGLSSQRSSDFFSLFFGKELYRGIYASFDYDFFRSEEKRQDTGENLVSALNHDLNGQVRLEPVRWISISSLYNLKFFDTETGDVSASRDELIQTHTLSLQPVSRVNVSASYTRSNLDNTIGFDEDSTNKTLSLHLLLNERINLNFSAMDQDNQRDGDKQVESDVLSSSADIKIFRGVDLILNYSNNHTKDFEYEGVTDSQRIRGRLRLKPRRSLTFFTTFEYNTSDNKFVKTTDIASKTILGRIDISWAIGPRLDLFLDVDYRNTESAGIKRDDLGYFANLVWRMNDKLTFFLQYRGGSNEEDVAGFRSQMKFPFIWDTRMSINYEIERGLEETDRKFLFVELTKIF